MDDRQTQTRERVLQVVLTVLESDGYDAVQVRTVAKRARISLSTLYRFFPTRDALIAAALRRWMETNAYADGEMPPPDASLYDVQMWVFRHLFEPWERSPNMLVAYHRARTGPCGRELDVQGRAAMAPAMRSAIDHLDPAYAADFRQILLNVYYALIARFAHGDIAVTDILPSLERAVFRLTADNAALAKGHPGPRAGRSA